MNDSPLMDSGFAVPVFSPRDDPIAYLNKAMALLKAVASSRPCTQPTRPRNTTWYKEKVMLAEAGQILDKEQLAFLADLGVPDVVLMVNISTYGSNVVLEVPYSETYLNDMENQSVHAMHDFEQTPAMDFLDNEIHSDSTLISAFDCNNARNALCNARMNASVDVNDLFVFDDVSIKKSHVSKMPFRKKPSASLNVPSRSKLNKSLPRIMSKWFPKLQPLAEPIAKWIPRATRQIDKIAKTPNSPGPIFKWVPKNMTGNRALLTNFVEKFLGTVHFDNYDFAVIAGYGDVVIGSMTIRKVYYVEGLGHNLFSVGQFCDKGLEVAFRKSTCFVRTEDGVDLLTGDRSSNLYTIALVGARS
nr:integrase, catalytic region, zinc finger, CCHC-type, peptidase aspartic, catalytic [Tanacetum cinerariifolium]